MGNERHYRTKRTERKRSGPQYLWKDLILSKKALNFDDHGFVELRSFG